MNRLDRLALWRDLSVEGANLVRDHEASMKVDADSASPRLDIRMAALRGLVNGLSAGKCPVASAWEAAADFLPMARLFVADDTSPAMKLQLGPKVILAAERLSAELDKGERQRADVFG